MHLWTTHDPELQATTASPLISTFHKSPHHLSSIFQPYMSSPSVPWYRLLTKSHVSLVIIIWLKPCIWKLSLSKQLIIIEQTLFLKKISIHVEFTSETTE
jgi:hypothetical protein